MENTVTKAAALAAYNNSVKALSRDLEITPQAIYQWADDAIPEIHALRLRFVLRPEFFREASNG